MVLPVLVLLLPGVPAVAWTKPFGPSPGRARFRWLVTVAAIVVALVAAAAALDERNRPVPPDPAEPSRTGAAP